MAAGHCTWLLFIFHFYSTVAYTSPLVSRSKPGQCSLRNALKTSTRTRTLFNQHAPNLDECEPCPPPESDVELDRREAAFSMIGSLWSMGIIATAAMPASFSNPQVANAVYGTDANIAIPNLLEGMNNRVNQQCLVESLGNRECLVYLDPAKKLYQGADSKIVLERLEKASEALATIPELIQGKKWSSVIGVLTGPMGTLAGTLNQLMKVSDEPSKAGETAKKLRAEIIAIIQSADKTNGQEVLNHHKLATEQLVIFAKSL